MMHKKDIIFLMISRKKCIEHTTNIVFHFFSSMLLFFFIWSQGKTVDNYRLINKIIRVNMRSELEC